MKRRRRRRLAIRSKVECTRIVSHRICDSWTMSALKTIEIRMEIDKNGWDGCKREKGLKGGDEGERESAGEGGKKRVRNGRVPVHKCQIHGSALHDATQLGTGMWQWRYRGLYVDHTINGCTFRYMTVHGHNITLVYTNFTQSYTLALETDRMQRDAKCVPRGDLRWLWNVPRFLFFFCFLFFCFFCVSLFSVSICTTPYSILRTYILEDRRVDHESVSSGKAPAMQVSAYAACRTPALHAIGAQWNEAHIYHRDVLVLLERLL